MIERDTSISSLLPKLDSFSRDPLATMDQRISGTLGRQRDFADVMSIARRRVDGGGAKTPEAEARDAAERFIAVTLVQPILDQARASDNAAPPFKPTEAEKQFRGMIDAQTAMNIVRSSRLPIVDRMARDLLRNADETAPNPTTEATA